MISGRGKQREHAHTQMFRHVCLTTVPHRVSVFGCLPMQWKNKPGENRQINWRQVETGRPVDELYHLKTH